VRVRVEAGARLDAILVDHAQGAEAHMLRVVIVAEGKAVPAVEPTEIGDAALPGGADCNHGDTPLAETVTVPQLIDIDPLGF
jgi:hypothetical protein